MRLKRLVSALCGCAFLLMFLGLTLGAQEVTSTIVGTAVDSSGAVIPGATVTLTDPSSGVKRTATSGADGVFRFPNLAAHTYNASITANGFQTKTVTGIILGASSTLDLGKESLQVGNQAQEVTVTAAATPIQTSSSEVSHTIQGTALNSLPLVGRDVFGALKLDAGVRSNANYDVVNEGDIGSISIDGNGGFGGGVTNFTVDGVTDIDTGSNSTTHYEPNEDAIQEVKILSSNYDAEFGRSSGGTITVITKSGTNKFHGSLWANHRHEEFNANNFFNNATHVKRPQYRYNIDGWSFGGPVPAGWLKNKLYFFGSQEYTNQKGSTTIEDVTVPSLKNRGLDPSEPGVYDFSDIVNSKGKPFTIYEPNTGTTPVSCNCSTPTATPFPGNVIPASMVNAQGLAMLEYFPAPNFTVPTGSTLAAGINYQTSASVPHPHRNDVLRIDFNPTSKLTSYFRWIRDIDDTTALFQGNQFNVGPIDHPNPGHGYAWSATYVLSPTLINTVTVGKSWNTWSWYFESASALADVSMKPSFDTALNPPTLLPAHTPAPFSRNPSDVNGYQNLLPGFSFGNAQNSMISHSTTTAPYYNANNIWTVDDDVSKVVGAHQLKTGVYVEYNTKLQPAGNGYAGSYNFQQDPTNPADTTDGFANGLLGNYDTFSQNSARTVFNVAYWNVEFYVQDSWRATRKLNLNLGVRFYHQTPQIDTNGTFSEFVPSLYKSQIVAGTPYANGVLYVPGCTKAMTAGAGTCAAQGGVVDAVNPNNSAVTGPAAYIGAFLPGANNANGLVALTSTQPPYTNKSVVVAPRLGFAYDVYGNGKTAIRGGFGVFYNRLDGNQVYGMSGQAPNSFSYAASQGSLSTIGPGVGVISPSTVTFFSGVQPIPMVKNASLGWEQELGFQTSLDVSYVGNWSTDQPLRSNQNPVPLGANFLASNVSAVTGKNLSSYASSSLERTKYPGLVDLNQELFLAYSNYNALQATISHQLSKGVLFGAAYTWSRNLGVTGYDPLMTLGAPFQNNAARNYGPLSLNRDQTLVVNYSWALPGVGNRYVGSVLNHWTFAGLYSFTSGAPYNLSFNTNGVDFTGSTNESPRPNEVSNPLVNVPAGYIYNPNAFAAPAVGQVGNLGNYPLNYPGYWDADMALTKFIPVGFNEGSGLSIQVQAYNVFNHPQFTGWGTNISTSSSAGLPTAAGEARVLAFNFRYSF